MMSTAFDFHGLFDCLIEWTLSKRLESDTLPEFKLRKHRHSAVPGVKSEDGSAVTAVGTWRCADSSLGRGEASGASGWAATLALTGPRMCYYYTYITDMKTQRQRSTSYTLQTRKLKNREDKSTLTKTTTALKDLATCVSARKGIICLDPVSLSSSKT